MKLFQVIRKNFALLGISSNESRFNRKSAKTFSIFILAITLGAVFLFFDANTFIEYTLNIFVTITVFAIWILFIVLVAQKENLFNLIDEFEGFFDEQPRNFALKAIMDKTNRRVENWCEIGHFVIVKVTPAFLIFPRAIISYAIFITTNAGSEAFDLPFLLWFPFDWKNPLGYLVAVTFQYVMVVHCLILVFCGVSFGIGCCVFAISIITKSVKNDLKLINESAASYRNLLQTMKLIADFINIHSFLKKFIDDCLNIFQIPIAVEFAWTLVTTCSAMLLIQLQIDDHDSIVLILVSIFVSYAFGINLCICEAGQRLMDGFYEIDDEIESFDWYLFSHEIQRMLPIILMMAQKPVELKCFGSISATRENAKKILKGAFSYFMTMRTLIK